MITVLGTHVRPNAHLNDFCVLETPSPCSQIHRVPEHVEIILIEITPLGGNKTFVDFVNIGSLLLKSGLVRQVSWPVTVRMVFFRMSL